MPIDQLTLNDPRRISFDQLHAYSVKALAIAMIAAFVGFIMVALRGRASSDKLCFSEERIGRGDN